MRGEENLVVNGVELGEYDAVNLTGPRGQVSCKGFVEHHELVDAIVPYESLTHEQKQVRVVHLHQLGKLPHELIVVLHATGRVDEHAVMTRALRFCDRGPGDLSWVLHVTTLKEEHVQAPSVGPQLLHGAGAEGVARSDHHLDTVLFKVVAHLGQAGGLAHAVDADEDDGIGFR